MLCSNAGGVAKAAPGEPKKVFGMTLPDNEGIAFIILAAGSLGSALGFAALQEGVFRIPGFKFSAWMTVLTTFTYFLCGALEMKLTGDTRKASWKNYGILSGAIPPSRRPSFFYLLSFRRCEPRFESAEASY